MDEETPRKKVKTIDFAKCAICQNEDKKKKVCKQYFFYISPVFVF